MAKYTIIMSCGHEDTVELFGKTSDRERKIEYFQQSGLCKECYKKKIEQQNESEGLVFNAVVLPHINQEDGNILLNVWFSGNTKPYKEQIKSLGGYRWGERESLEDMFSMSDSLCWNKTINIEDYQNESEKAISIGAKIADIKDNLYTTLSYRMAAEAQKKWKVKRDKVSEIVKPDTPEVIKGHKWNRKIYGKSGGYSIYPDGEKVSITDDQAKEIRDYLDAMEEYNKKVEAIKNA